VSKAFERRHGRKPRFFIDKFSCDPADCESNTLLWPVYMLACRKVLVLYSDTYKDQLRCLFELFLTYATVCPGKFESRVQVVDLTSYDYHDRFKKLSVYGYSTAVTRNKEEGVLLRKRMLYCPGGKFTRQEWINEAQVAIERICKEQSLMHEDE